ncbi:sulfate adenylyltransferase subunit 1 [Stigmatella aurantiaca]|uniref:sulfate adenylyltransferase n=1 Tax=Stigmatella aurantiaca (strain DW4/3-1) TaxID=378806 RepID=Q08RF5_STIAD|nr:GTP-binding protein [Stigmatella aurantiaca]ADO70718.1 Sulfate adenyltransferase, large subunit [Stigmatella aurantiaca DW4/3-1]EAU63058.1 CysN/CysC bifunctional enzyme [Stigmatella aurantiaca DW4/3-1]
MNTSLQPITDVSVFLAAHADKELLRLVVVGSVDDGKSTLIGRLLYECDGLFEDQISAVRRATAKRAAAAEATNGAVGTLTQGLQNAAAGPIPGEDIDFSLFTDGLRAEREQGITIDVAYRYFSTPRRKVIVADTPGHIQYTRNMATGASTADAAVILADARLGVLPQTRRHAYIASLLGIPYLAVAVNKMDMVDFDRAVFERIGRELADFARPLGFTQIRLFPVSARQGDNITQASTRTPWHEGGTLLAWLESLPHQRHLDAAPLRFPVQYVLRPHQNYRGFAGQIASGSVRVGDEVMVLPSQRRTRVTAIDTFEGSQEQQGAPHSVTLRLADEVDISRGDVITHLEQPPAVLHQLEAMLVWFGEQPLDRSRRYLVKHTTRTVPTTIEQVLWRMDLENLSEVPAESLSLNDIGKVHLVCKRPLLCDSYRVNRRTGSFIVIDALTHDTVAAGMILGPAGARAGRAQVGSLITAEERRARLGQPGGVFLLPDAPDAEERAFQLERRLFDLGRHVSVVRGDTEVALALAETGLFVLFHTTAPQARRNLRDHGLALEPSADLDGWVKQILSAQERHHP